MSIKDRFNKLRGKEPETLSDRQRWHNAVVRTGNYDYAGRQIDANPGGPITRFGALWDQYAERVADFMKRDGNNLEQPWRIKHQTMAGNQFDRDSGATERAHDGRFDKRHDRNVASVNEFLRDGASAPPKKRDR
jgi:hypothetical protein